MIRIHFRGLCALSEAREVVLRIIAGDDSGQHQWHARLRGVGPLLLQGRRRAEQVGDRKSTRLNSSHSQISYAVFCLKKKKQRSAWSSYRRRPCSAFIKSSNTP